MKVKMLTASAGPEGTRKAGDIVDVKEKEGKDLIDGGFAEKVDVEKTFQKKQEEEAKKKQEEEAKKQEFNGPGINGYVILFLDQF